MHLFFETLKYIFQKHYLLNDALKPKCFLCRIFIYVYMADLIPNNSVILRIITWCGIIEACYRFTTLIRREKAHKPPIRNIHFRYAYAWRRIRHLPRSRWTHHKVPQSHPVTHRIRISNFRFCLGGIPIQQSAVHLGFDGF